MFLFEDPVFYSLSHLFLCRKTIIRVEELVEAMKKLDKVEDADKFQRIFDAFDEDKDGVIETSEVLNVSLKLRCNSGG